MVVADQTLHVVGGGVLVFVHHLEVLDEGSPRTCTLELLLLVPKQHLPSITRIPVPPTQPPRCQLSELRTANTLYSQDSVVA